LGHKHAHTGRRTHIEARKIQLHPQRPGVKCGLQTCGLVDRQRGKLLRGIDFLRNSVGSIRIPHSLTLLPSLPFHRFPSPPSPISPSGSHSRLFIPSPLSSPLTQIQIGARECCKLPHRGPGQNPGLQRNCMYFRLGNRRWWCQFSVGVMRDKFLQITPY